MKIWDWLRWQTGLGYDAPIGPNPFPPPPPPPPDNPPGPEDDLGGPVKFSMHSSEVGGPYVGATFSASTTPGTAHPIVPALLHPARLRPGSICQPVAAASLGPMMRHGRLVPLATTGCYSGSALITSGKIRITERRSSHRDWRARVPRAMTFTRSTARSLIPRMAFMPLAWCRTIGRIMRSTNNVDSGTGNTNGEGYGFGGSAGYILPLWNTTGVSTSAMPTKAPPSPRYGGYATFVDLSGHVLYRNDWDNGFTDSTGFVFGTERISYNGPRCQRKPCHGHSDSELCLDALRRREPGSADWF